MILTIKIIIMISKNIYLITERISIRLKKGEDLSTSKMATIIITTYFV